MASRQTPSKVIKIGAVVTTRGPAGLLGQSFIKAIQLAKELRADRLLIDDFKGRKLAEREGVHVIGLLGVILLAKTKALIPSARILLQRLQEEADFYLSEEILTTALKSVGE